MKSAGTVIGAGVALLALADVLASSLSWRGAATDTTWEPSFWKYEVARLSQWLPLVVITAVLVFAVVYILSRYPNDIRRHVPSASTLAAVLLSVAAFGVECTTSVRFWKSLPPDEARMLWFSQRTYLREHSASWLLSVALITLATLYWRRRHTRRGA